MAVNARRSSSGNIGVHAAAAANSAAPARFAASTTNQRRATFDNVGFGRSRDSSGRMTVSVCSVNSCCRPRITIRNPAE
jgi:hypothetical protein